MVIIVLNFFQKNNNMKAKLEFNLDDMDDEMAHMRCIKSLDMVLAMHGFASKLKMIVDRSEDGKYIDEALVWEAWSESLDEYNILLDNLIR